MKRLLVPLVIFAAFSAGAQPVRAEEPRPVRLTVRSDHPLATAATIRDAVARELHAPVVVDVAVGSPAAGRSQGTATVTYRHAEKQLVVSWQDDTHGAMTRAVEAPPNPADVPRTAALLLGNLARDEATELLGPATPPPAPSPAPVPPQPAAPPAPPYRLANAALFYPVATNFQLPNVHTHFEFNVLHGHLGSLSGVQIGGSNLVEDEMAGAQVGGLFSLSGASQGLQLSGAFNTTRGTLDGMQTTLGVNHAGDEVRGGQVGLVNLARANVDGLQLGALNVAKNVRGLQLGVINIADDVEGVPLGLISVTKTGGVHPVVWFDPWTYINVGVNFATKYTYTMLHFAAHTDHDTETRSYYGGGFTIGARVALPPFFVTFDVQYIFLLDTTNCCSGSSDSSDPSRADQNRRDLHLQRLRTAVGLAIFERFRPFVGTGLLVREEADAGGKVSQVDFRPDFFAGIEF